MKHDPSRRRFLNRFVLTAGTIALAGSPLIAVAGDGDTLTWRGQRHRIKPGRDFFPQSVASFEPRSESLILWARLEDRDFPGQDLPLTLLVGTDPWMLRIVAASEVISHAGDDGVVQVKLTALKPKTRYYYRFVYEKAGQHFGSVVGRTQTAPDPGNATPVSFALTSCQDAVGRYFNTYLAALPQDLDFVLHVGDYIYETTGDPSFQTPGGRRIEFSDPEGAIALEAPGGQTYHAAASLSNYRELYRFYRSDAALQRMHERFPYVIIWDDHEYSDDCWGDVATYYDGRTDEKNTPRRLNAERAFFEYVAVDDGVQSDGQIESSRRALYPDGRLYRDFRYGKNLHLILTDYRSFRPDHLIPEDAFPGTVAVDRAALTALLARQGVAYEDVKDRFAPYVDLDAPQSPVQDALFSIYKPVLTGVLAQAYAQNGLSPAEAAAKAAGKIQGKLDATVVNQLLASYNAAQSADVPLISDGVAEDRGISFLTLGKTGLFSSLGARYFVVQPTYDLYAAYKTAVLDDPDAENPYGAAQFDWLRQTLLASDARWKVVVNSTSLTSMVLDLTGELAGLPQAIKDLLVTLPSPLRNRFYLNVDQFDGFPNFRRKLLDLYASVEGVALLAGDIHASFAARHAGKVWEFTGPAVSSSTFRAAMNNIVLSDAQLSRIPGVADLVAQLDLLLPLANSEIKYVETAVNGFVSLLLSADRIHATYWQVDGAYATSSFYDQPARLLSRLIPKQIVAR
ncbi:MAG: alkaline phosphatase D family protein [Rhodocyclaceae bacterium]